VHRAAALAVRGDEPRAAFLGKPRLLHRLGDAEDGEGVVGGREQRLADVKAGKGLALEEHDGMPELREPDRGGASRRPSAGDGEGGVVGLGHRPRRYHTRFFTDAACPENADSRHSYEREEIMIDRRQIQAAEQRYAQRGEMTESPTDAMARTAKRVTRVTAAAIPTDSAETG